MKEQDSDKTLSPRDWDPLLKKIVVVCWFVNSVKSRRWQEDGLTLTVQIIRMRPNLFVYLSMCKWLCVLSTLVLRHKAAYIFKRLVGDGAKVMLLVDVHFPWRAGSGSLGDYRLHCRQTEP